MKRVRALLTDRRPATSNRKRKLAVSCQSCHSRPSKSVGASLGNVEHLSHETRCAAACYHVTLELTNELFLRCV